MISRPVRAACVAVMMVVTGVLSSAGHAHATSSAILIGPQEISQRSQPIWVFTDAPVGAPIEVYVNGRLRATKILLESPSGGETYIDYEHAWGLGRIQLRHDATVSKVEPLVAAIDIGRYELKRVGAGARQVRIKITSKRYHPGKNTWVKGPRPLLQAKRGRWVNITKMRLDRSGTGQVTLTPRKAANYRFLVKKTKKNLRTVTTTGRF